MTAAFKQRIFQGQFNDLALEAFYFQAEQNPIYAQYLKALKRDPAQVKSLEEIPFLPISFYKKHKIVSGQVPVQAIFESSGTTGSENSKHYMSDLLHYERVAKHIFEAFYGPLEEWTILALLPSYLERNNSSLVYMVNGFLKYARPESGFYLHNTEALLQKVAALKGQKIMLIGVTFALLDLAEAESADLSGCVVMETGGMKGRKKELLREEVHEILTQSFGVSAIHSEYGMTELTSQGYSKGAGLFDLPPWMRVQLRDINDPFSIEQRPGRPGGVNVIDLANIDTCCFIETQDLGRMQGGQLEILGRFDYADIRGCNLMVI